MVKFLADSHAAIGNLNQKEAEQANTARKEVLEYIDSVGLVVLKLYEITEKLDMKTQDPYSYTMAEYNLDIEKFKKLYNDFQAKGDELNKLFYSR